MDSPNLKLLMFPWLAYGHISPFLELAKRLSSRNSNIQTYICSTLVNLDSIKDKIPVKLISTSIHLVELHLPPSPVLPPHYHTTNGLPLHLNGTLRQALDSSAPAFSAIMDTIKPDLVVHDILIGWVSGVASSVGIPAVPFLTAGAAMCSYFTHAMMKPDVEYPFPEMKLVGVEQDMVDGIVELQKNAARGRDGVRPPQPVMTLIKSSRGIEDRAIDYLSELMGWNLVPVGTLVCHDSNLDDDRTWDDLFEWLNRKEKCSTIFLSFGSEYFLKREDIEEIAHGLELSEANFVWVIRFPRGEEVPVEEVLPEGFLERVGERGRVLDKWAPQGRILGHPSVGGFVSHCGWSSFMESVELGVPIIAMPMHLDQPLNGKLIVALGVGVGVGRNEEGRFQRGEIGNAIRSVLDGKNGESLRERVRQVREDLRARCEAEIDGFIQQAAQLCAKKE